MALSLMIPIFSNNASASEVERKTVRIAVSDDENIIIDRIIYTALNRLGYDVVVSSMGMKTAIMSVDNGENDLLAVQAIGIEDIYTNLIPIEVPISYVDMVTYTNADSNQTFDSWEDLNGLRVVYHAKNTHVENHIPSGAEKYSFNDYEQLYNEILNDNADVLVMPVTELSAKVLPEGIKGAGIVEVVDTYSFVNNNHPELAEQLAVEYAKMLKDGTIYKIKNNLTADDTKDKVVLHISSYSSEMLWENNLVHGVKEALSGAENVTYYNLALNLKRLSNTQAQYELMEKSIHATFIDRAPDIIITSDNNALDFVVKNYSMLFNNIPVVYCGINNYSDEMVYGLEEHITGLRETTSAVETMQEMLRLFPDTEKIYILNDDSITGRMCRNQMEEQFSSYEGKVTLQYNQNEPLIDIMNEISAMGKNTLVLCGTFYVDGTGKYYSEQEFAETLGDGLTNPIFCLSGADIGFGTIIGGKVSDGYKHGHGAGELALEVLDGKTISELVIADNADKLNTWMFDYKAAKKSGLKTNELYSEHIAYNRELSLLESNPVEAMMLISLLVFAIFVAAIVGIFAFVLRKKNNSLLEIQKHLHTAEELLEKDNEIRRSQEDLYSLLNSVMQPVLVVDMESNLLLYVNDAYVKTFSYLSRKDALAHGIENLLEIVKSSGEHEFTTCNGRKFFGRVMVNCVRFNERAAYAAVIQDITTDILKTKMLQKTANLERKENELKSQFVVNMSHELRTPMNAIIGLSQVALKKDFEKDAHEMFYKVNNSARLLLDLINDVLDFSKIEANKIEIFTDEFELESVLNDAFAVVAPRIETKDIELQLKIDERLPQYILGDRTRVWQVLKNILDNSAKFTEQGKIALNVTLEKEITTNVQVLIKFVISDTGVGMSNEQLNSLYKPFEQFHEARSAVAGTGLGMTITKQLVQLMNGEINVSSMQGEGTTTTIIIPFQVSDTIHSQHDDGTSEETQAVYPNVAVLLVEDNEINQEVANSMLEFYEIHPVIVGNGKEAIEMLEKQHFDLVFMDLLMPVMDGHEATKYIRASDKPYRDITIVAMTANVVKEEIELCMRNGMNDHIGKPIEFKRLDTVLNKWLK